MRWICLFLLLANVVYALWYGVNVQALPSLFDLSVGGETDTQLLVADKGKRLVLLSETDALDIEHNETLLPQKSFVGAESPVGTVKAAAAENVEQAIVMDVDFNKNAAFNKSVAPNQRIDSVEIEQVLTAESDRVAESEMAVESVLVAESPKHCWAAGPVLEPTAADHLTQRAKALAKAVDKRSLNVKTGEEFWVYLPPLSSYKEALTQLKTLQKRKIDSFVVTSGEFANAISLGLFSKQALAKRHQVNMRKKGINAVIEVKDRTRREYWVHFQLQQSLESGLKNRIQGELPKLNWRSLPCSERLAAD